MYSMKPVVLFLVLFLVQMRDADAQSSVLSTLPMNREQLLQPDSARHYQLLMHKRCERGIMAGTVVISLGVMSAIGGVVCLFE